MQLSLGDSDSMPNFVRRAFPSSCGDFLELVLGEEIVEDAQGRLQIKVDNVFRSGLRLRKSTIHHELKSETYVCHFLIERLRCEVEVIEGDKVTLQQAGKQAEINPVRELGLQLGHLQVDLVEVLVHKSHQALLHHLQLVRCVVEEGVEGVPLAAHSHVVVERGQLLRDHSVGEHPLSFCHNHDIHNNILWQSNRSPEMPCKSDQKVEDGDDVLRVNRLNAPTCLA